MTATSSCRCFLSPTSTVISALVMESITRFITAELQLKVNEAKRRASAWRTTMEEPVSVTVSNRRARTRTHAVVWQGSAGDRRPYADHRLVTMLRWCPS